MPLASWPVPLVCPRCRGRREGGFHASPLSDHPAGLACTSCGAVFPEIDGVPVILANVDGWLEQEAVSLLARYDLPEAVMARLAQGAGGALARDHALLRVYSKPPGGSLPDAVAARSASMEPPILDLGAGLGLCPRPDAVAVDLNYTLVRRHPGRSMVADALDPPFQARSFASILALNLFDSCRDPLLLLQQCLALLAPGGSLLLSTALAWQDTVTPPALQISEAALWRFLSEHGHGASIESREEHTWILSPGPRTEHRHRPVLLHLRAPGDGVA